MRPRLLPAFAVLTTALTLALLGAGGLVTSHGVGMAVPDWPNTYGYNMFFFPVSQWVGGVFYEHTHRLLASGVGLCTAILTIWLYGRSARPFLRWVGVILLAVGLTSLFLRPAHWADAVVALATGLAGLAASLVWPRCDAARPWLRRLGLIAFFAVVLQGVLGGLRVVLFKDQIGIFHATLAQLFFTLTCALTLFTSRWWAARYGSPWSPAASSPQDSSAGTANAETLPRPEFFGTSPALQRLCLAVAGLILLQLVLGATMRHQHAGLSIPDFPTAYGKWWPPMDAQSVAHYNQHRLEVVDLNPITSFQIMLQMVHRLVAVLILSGVACSAWLAWRTTGLRSLVTRLSLGWFALILVQALLGAATIWSNKAADVATAHVLVGALGLATSAGLSIILTKDRLNQTKPSLQSVTHQNDLASSFAAHPASAVGLK